MLITYIYSILTIVTTSADADHSLWIILIWLTLLTIVIAGIITKRRTGKNKCDSKNNIPKYEITGNDYAMRNHMFCAATQSLRSPLSLITTPLHEILTSKEVSPEVAQRLKIVYKNAVDMQASFEILSDINRDDSYYNRLKVGKYDIFTISDYIVCSFSELINVKQININYNKSVAKPTPFNIWIDRQKIELVIKCFIYKAIQNTDCGNEISLDIEQKNNYCIICCKYKDSEIRTEIDDSIIYIFAQILRLHHGNIEFARHKIGEVSVIFNIPLGKEHFRDDKNIEFVATDNIITDTTKVDQSFAGSYTKEEEFVVEQNRNKYKILIVEDNKDIRTYLNAILSPLYDIIFAEDGQQGVEAATNELPNLILCDIMMPVKDGFECCSEIKENLKTCHIPVVMLTAKTEDDDIVRGTLVGADDYLIKPFNADILKAKISNLIKSRITLKKSYMKLLEVTSSNSANADNNGQPIDEENNFIARTINIIEQNIQEPDFSVKKLAEIIGMSQSTLYRKVKLSSDFTIIELIRGVRLKRAATLLKQQQYNVHEVVEIVGYNDIPTFRKHFVDLFGMTPSAYASSGLNKDK